MQLCGTFIDLPPMSYLLYKLEGKNILQRNLSAHRTSIESLGSPLSWISGLKTLGKGCLGKGGRGRLALVPGMKTY